MQLSDAGLTIQGNITLKNNNTHTQFLRKYNGYIFWPQINEVIKEELKITPVTEYLKQ